MGRRCVERGKRERDGKGHGTARVEREREEREGREGEKKGRGYDRTRKVRGHDLVQAGSFTREDGGGSWRTRHRPQGHAGRDVLYGMLWRNLWSQGNLLGGLRGSLENVGGL